MIDTHAHLNSECYRENFETLLENILKNDVEKVIIPAVNPKTYQEIIDLTEKYDCLYGGIGIQPEEIDDLPQNWEEMTEKFCQNKKIVAIGEIGLDYYWIKDEENHKRQKEIFIKQIEIAKYYNLPILIHDREAHKDTFDIISSMVKDEIPVVMHCFSGSPEFAQRCIKQGWYLAFGGVTTFKNAKKAKESVKVTPLDKILLETDSPYLTPVPYRGQENTPAYLKYIAEEIANIKDTTIEEIAINTTKNAERIFNFNGEK
jgi:TatD DNase family protein